MDSTCLDDMMTFRINGMEEDILRSIADKNGDDMELVDNAINLLSKVEEDYNVAIDKENLRRILIDAKERGF